MARSGRHRTQSQRLKRKDSGAHSPSQTTAQKRLKKALRKAGISKKWLTEPLQEILVDGKVSETANFDRIYLYTLSRGFRVSALEKGFSVEIIPAEVMIKMFQEAIKAS